MSIQIRKMTYLQMTYLLVACLILSSCGTKSIRVQPTPYKNISAIEGLDCQGLEERLVAKIGDLFWISAEQDRRSWRGDDYRTVVKLSRLKGEISKIDSLMTSKC